TNRSGLLTERSINAADNFSLAIEIDNALLDQTGQFQVAIELEHLLGHQRSLFDAASHLALSDFARRILRVDANLKGRTPGATLSVFCFFFRHSLVPFVPYVPFVPFA